MWFTKKYKVNNRKNITQKNKKKYYFNKKSYKPIITKPKANSKDNQFNVINPKDKQDKLKLFALFKKIHTDLSNIKKNIKNNSKNKTLTLNDYYYLHNVRNLLINNDSKILNHYNKSKKIGKNIKNILINLKQDENFKHLETNKILNKIKKKSKKKKLTSKIFGKNYENKNFAEFFASNYIKKKINKSKQINNSKSMENRFNNIISIYNEIVTNINNNEQYPESNSDPISVLNISTIKTNEKNSLV